MGVPGLFRWLTQHARSVRQERLQNNNPLSQSVQVVAIDANSLIHQAASQTLTESPQTWSEEMFFQRVIDLIQSVVCRARPSRAIIVAVDGVCPFAKVLQQRQRRYKAKIVPHTSLSCAEKFNDAAGAYDSNSITPGTDVMIRLDHFLRTWLDSLEFRQSELFSGKRIYYSNHLVPGEGEHKLLAIVRQHHMSDSVCIHGVDGDLILLGAILQEQMNTSTSSAFGPRTGRVWLMREENTNLVSGRPPNCSVAAPDDRSNETVVVDVSSFVQTIRREWNFEDTLSFVTLVCLAGNDFLPNVPGFEQVTDAIDSILRFASSNRAARVSLWNKQRLSVEHFAQFLAKFSRLYETQLLTSLTRVRFAGPHQPLRCAQIGSAQVLDLNAFRSAHYMIESLCRKCAVDPEARQLLASGGDFSKEDVDGAVRSVLPQMVRDFVQGLEWTVRYYAYGAAAVDVEWYYSFSSSPMLSDFAFTLSSSTAMSSSAALPCRLTSSGSFLHPLEQLLCVLPVASLTCLPSELRQVLVAYCDTHKNGVDTAMRDTFPEQICWRQNGLRSGHEQILMTRPNTLHVQSIVRHAAVSADFLARYQQQKTIEFVAS